MTPEQIAYEKCVRSAHEYGLGRFGVAADRDFLEKLIRRVDRIRNSAPRGKQYLLPHALRQALNELEYSGDTRIRYRAMVGHFYFKLKEAGLKKIPKEQIPLTGLIEIDAETGQLGWKM